MSLGLLSNVCFALGSTFLLVGTLLNIYRDLRG